MVKWSQRTGCAGADFHFRSQIISETPQTRCNYPADAGSSPGAAPFRQ